MLKMLRKNCKNCKNVPQKIIPKPNMLTFYPPSFPLPFTISHFSPFTLRVTGDVLYGAVTLFASA